MIDIGVAVGVGLSIFILSYVLLGENPLYRLALHVFIGGLIGYGIAIAISEVMIDTLVVQLLERDFLVALPTVLGILLLVKGLPKYAYVGNLSVAYLVGVGVAVALGGALLGTLIPQVEATALTLSIEPTSLYTMDGLRSLLDGLLVVVGTICTLLMFQFTGRTEAGGTGIGARLVGVASWIGRVFLTCALGVAFAGAFTTFLSIFIGRVQEIIQLALQVIPF